MNDNNSNFAVAIDGPGGAGKSTAAKGAAKKLGMVYIDTGAMYRAVALYSIKEGANTNDINAISRLLPEIDIEIIISDAGQRVLLNGADVTEELRTQEIAEGASVVSQYMPIREKLTAMQRQIADKNRVIMDGRDIGSVVLPNAQVKIFMDASFDVRVDRRIKELLLKGQQCDRETIKNEMATRDARDASRDAAPMIQASDAVYLDTSLMSEDEAVESVLKIINQKIYN